MLRRAIQRGAPTSSAVEYVQKLAKDERSVDHLVALLAESAPIYAGRRADEVNQMRAIILGAFERHRLPDRALPFVLEELESGENPQTVAAAAKALRNATWISPQAIGLLVRAIDRFAEADDVVESSHLDRTGPTTVLAELIRTLVGLAPRAAAECLDALRSVAERHRHALSEQVRAQIEQALASLSAERPIQACCCEGKVVATECKPITVTPVPNDVVLQDQDGELTTFASFFTGRPSVVTFFYTRCMVPEKCSLTITKLAHLQRAIAAGPRRNCFNIAAITYDPAFDIPTRLRAYGMDRGMAFDRRVRMLRTPQGIEPLRRYFDLQVGFGASTVNRHRLELFVLGDKAEIAASFTRMQWDAEEICSTLQLL